MATSNHQTAQSAAVASSPLRNSIHLDISPKDAKDSTSPQMSPKGGRDASPKKSPAILSSDRKITDGATRILPPATSPSK